MHILYPIVPHVLQCVEHRLALGIKDSFLGSDYDLNLHDLPFKPNRDHHALTDRLSLVFFEKVERLWRPLSSWRIHHRRLG